MWVIIRKVTKNKLGYGVTTLANTMYTSWRFHMTSACREIYINRRLCRYWNTCNIYDRLDLVLNLILNLRVHLLHFVKMINTNSVIYFYRPPTNSQWALIFVIARVNKIHFTMFLYWQCSQNACICQQQCLEVGIISNVISV